MPRIKSNKQKGPSASKQQSDDLHHVNLWNDMLIQEEGDDIVGEIMDELLNRVMDECYKVETDNQVIPYMVSWAQNCLTQAVEQQFWCLDDWKEPDEICGTEDSEPVPSTPDSWAQGCVPVVNAANQPHCTSQQEFNNDHAAERKKSSVEKDWDAVSPTNAPVNQAETETIFKKPISHSPIPRPPAKTHKKKKQQVNSPPKNPPGKLLPPLSSPLGKRIVEVKSHDAEDTALKLETTSAHRHRDRQPMPKLDPSRLPQRYLFPEYEILDQTKPNPKKLDGLSRLEPKSNARQTARPAPSLKPLTSSMERFQKRNEDDTRLSKNTTEQRGFSGLVRLDKMVLAKGVSVVDSQFGESIPLKCDHVLQSVKLKPIRNDAAVPLYSVASVTAGPPPKVTPLVQNQDP